MQCTSIPLNSHWCASDSCWYKYAILSNSTSTRLSLLPSSVHSCIRSVCVRSNLTCLMYMLLWEKLTLMCIAPMILKVYLLQERNFISLKNALRSDTWSVPLRPTHTKIQTSNCSSLPCSLSSAFNSNCSLGSGISINSKEWATLWTLECSCTTHPSWDKYRLTHGFCGVTGNTLGGY